uniref:Ig-like domain-containing protein n=1 Tax=Parastrongyloides trichosuri TaxID=131310 RepID=A0A0N5A4A9_PARTI
MFLIFCKGYALKDKVFLSEPVSVVIVYKGTSEALQCRTNGFQNPYITWYKKDKQNHQTTVGKSKNLLIENIEEKDEGIYTCKIQEGDKLYSSSVHVKVQEDYLKTNSAFLENNFLGHEFKMGLWSAIIIISAVTVVYCGLVISMGFSLTSIFNIFKRKSKCILHI